MKAYYKYIIPVTIIIILLVISNRNKNKIENEIKKNECETIGKVSEISRTRSATRVNYYYYYNGEKFNSSEIKNEASGYYLFKYYKVKISCNIPSYSRVLLNEEVRDTVMILNSGFKHVIKYNNLYDSKTNSYNRIKSDHGFE